MSGALLATETAPITFSFNEVPSNIAVPGAYMEVAANYDASGLIAYPAKVCILAPIVAGGTITPLIPVQIFTPQQADALFGANGVGAKMCRAFMKANPFTPLWAMGIVDAGGAAAATWTIAFTASALTGPPGPLNLYIGGQLVSVTVTPGVDTASTIAANVQAAITAATGLPVTATVSTGTVTLTARDKGALLNGLDVRFNLTPGDIFPGGQTAGTPKLTATITNLATGVGVNVVANAFAAIPGTWFTDFVVPWTDATTITAVTAELTRRFNSMNKLDARAWSAASASSLTNLLAVVASINSPFWSILGLQNLPTAPWELAATYAAVATFALTNDPARQLKGLVLPGVVPPLTADILNLESEFQTLLTGGVATATVENDGTVRIQRAITTYLTAAGGIADTTWTDIMTAATMSRIRYDWESFVMLQYPRNKMAADGSLAAEYDDTIVTPRRMHSSWGARCRLYEQMGWIQNSQATVKASVFQLDASNPNRMNSRQQVQLINNLMILAGQLQFSLLPVQGTTAQTQ